MQASSDTQGRPRGSEKLWFATVMLVSVAVYLNALPNGFVYDDHFQIEANGWIRDFSHVREIFSNPVWGFWGRGGNSYYRPLMHLAYAGIYRLSGLAPIGYHLANVLLHAANSGMAFLFALKLHRLSGRGDDVTALPFAVITGMIFAVHPVQTEAVSVIAALPELSFAFFVLLALLAYPYRAIPTPPARRRARIMVSASCAFLALLCKETGIVLFPLLATVDLFLAPRGRGSKAVADGLVRYAPFIAVLAAYMIIRERIFGTLAAAWVRQDWPLTKTAMNALFLAGKYVVSLALPIRLNFFQLVRPVTSASDPGFLGMAAVATACGILAIRSLKTDRLSTMGWVFLFLPLAPVLYPPALATLFGVHNLYLPMLGFGILLGRVAISFWQRTPAGRRAVIGIMSAILSLLAVMTIARNPVYKDDATLWRDVGEKIGDASPLHFQRGYWLMEEGRLAEGIEEMRAALALRPDYPGAAYNLGIAFAKLGRDDEARGYLEIAVKEKPADLAAHSSLAALHFRQGR
ncbi:MAG TPA: tetratricopeptide repeat protein, partial [Candidatus Deferrimicrobiaceae bacterium]